MLTLSSTIEVLLAITILLTQNAALILQIFSH
jgi:hypothetical protein